MNEEYLLPELSFYGGSSDWRYNLVREVFVDSVVQIGRGLDGGTFGDASFGWSYSRNWRFSLI